MPHPHYSRGEIIRRGKAIYERDIRHRVEQGNEGKHLVVDIETGNYEIAEDDLTATRRALARNPAAALYGVQIGFPTAYRLGGCGAAQARRA